MIEAEICRGLKSVTESDLLNEAIQSQVDADKLNQSW